MRSACPVVHMCDGYFIHVLVGVAGLLNALGVSCGTYVRQVLHSCSCRVSGIENLEGTLEEKPIIYLVLCLEAVAGGWGTQHVLINLFCGVKMNLPVEVGGGRFLHMQQGKIAIGELAIAVWTKRERERERERERDRERTR